MLIGDNAAANTYPYIEVSCAWAAVGLLCGHLGNGNRLHAARPNGIELPAAFTTLARAGKLPDRWSSMNEKHMKVPSLTAMCTMCIQVREPSARVEHEASTSKIGEDQLFYFQQRGVDMEEAVGMIISGARPPPTGVPLPSRA